MNRRAERLARIRSGTSISGERIKIADTPRGSDPLEEETISDPDRIRRTISRLLADDAVGVLRSAGAPYPDRALRLARVQPTRDLPLAFDVAGGCPTGDVEIELFGPSSIYRFSPARYDMSAGLFATSMPHVVRQQRSRRARRLRVEGVQVSFAHPDQPHARVSREVVDVSLDGLGMRAGYMDGLVRDQRIDVVIDWQERGRMRLRGVVRHVSADLEGTGATAGIELTVDEGEDARRWRKHVEAVLWPTTIGDGSYAEDVWECLVEAGYCNLSEKSVEDFEDLRQAFVGATRAIASRPEIGAQLVIPSGRGVEATLSTLRIYDRAHFLYGVAKQPGRTPRWINGRKILRDLYVHALERMAPDPNAEWLVVWVQRQAEFTRYVHHEMAQRYASVGRTAVARVDVMEAERSFAPEVKANVQLADADEIDLVLEGLRELRSPIYLDAFDLVPEKFQMRDLKEAWARAGLVRDRVMFVARVGQEIVAAAVAEMASEGLHLFRLFDTVRTFTLREGGEAELPGLLAAARQWYADLGKPTFIYVREDLQTRAPRGFRSLALTDVTIFPSRLHPELIEHVHDLTASLWSSA